MGSYNKRAQRKVESYIEIGVSEGATLVTDGRKLVPNSL